MLLLLLLLAETGIQQYWFGIQNPGVCNQEYSSWNPESCYQLEFGIRNPSSTDKVPRRGIQNPRTSWTPLIRGARCQVKKHEKSKDYCKADNNEYFFFQTIFRLARRAFFTFTDVLKFWIGFTIRHWIRVFLNTVNDMVKINKEPLHQNWRQLPHLCL